MFNKILEVFKHKDNRVVTVIPKTSGSSNNVIGTRQMLYIVLHVIWTFRQTWSYEDTFEFEPVEINESFVKFNIVNTSTSQSTSFIVYEHNDRLELGEQPMTT